MIYPFANKTRSIKKLLFFASFFVFLPTGQATGICIQKIQPAINTQGQCREFATPCDVPAGWTKVDSCKEAKLHRRQKRSSYFNRRLGNKYWRKAKQKSIQPSRRGTVTRGRLGGGSYTRSTRLTRRTAEELEQLKEKKGALPRNTYGKKRFTRSALNRYKTLNKKDPSHKQEGQLTKKERYKLKVSKWGQHRPAFKSRTRVNRKGAIKTTAWKKQAGSHFKEQKFGGVSKYWAPSWKTKRIKKKKRMPQSISHKRGWKGKRLEGDLSGEIVD